MGVGKRGKAEHCADAAAPSQPVVLGRLGAPHGVKGWLKAHAFTNPAERLLDYLLEANQLLEENRLLEEDQPLEEGQVWLRMPRERHWRRVRVEEGRLQGRALMVRLRGIDDREAARLLTGGELAVEASALPELEPGEYYWYQLLGLAVETLDGQRLGRIDHLLETGANDVLVVQGDAESIDRRERLLPYLPEQVVVSVDLAEGLVRVDWDPDF